MKLQKLLLRALVARNLRGAFKEALLTRPHLLALLLYLGDSHSFSKKNKNSKFLVIAKALVARNLRGAFKEALLTRPHLLALLLYLGDSHSFSKKNKNSKFLVIAKVFSREEFKRGFAPLKGDS